MNFRKVCKVTLSILTIASLFAALSGCQEADRKQGQLDHKGRMFEYEHIELDNGLDVITLEDFSCPIVAVQVWYHVGSKNEDPQRQGFAHMFEHMMFKGTDHVGETEHFSLINGIGGSANGYTGFDRTVYLETLPANQIELALWLEAERMGFLEINQEHFDTERNVVEEELRMNENEPYGTLFKKVARELFHEHPYRWMPIGELTHLRAASVRELREFWTKYYVPNNATLIIVGAVKHEEAQKLAKKYFGWMPRWSTPPRVTVEEPLPKEARTIVIDDENAPTGAVGIVWRTVPRGHPDEIVLDMLSQILGGDTSSRLYRELVAKKTLAVQAMATTYNVEDDGIFVVGAAQNPISKDSQPVLEVLRENVARVRTEGIRADELEKARNKKLYDLVTGNLTIRKKAEMLGDAAVIQKDLSAVNTLLDEIRSVTVDDIELAANQYLTEDTSLTVIIEQNQKGAMASQRNDEDSEITAEREEKAVPPGRPGVTRPAGFPQSAPKKAPAPFNPTPEFTEAVLDNGLKVMVVPNHEVPFVTVMLGLQGGAWTEHKPGTANVALQMLVKGTENYTEGELASELARNAITLTGAAEMDTSSVHAAALSEYSDKAMELLSEVVMRPTFEADEFEKLRQQILTSLAIESQEPRYLVNKELRRRLYGEHPYSRTVKGEVEEVQALTAKDADLWWQKWARPDQSTVIFAGDITHEQAVELTQKYLGDWQTNLVEVGLILPDLPDIESLQIYLVDRPGSIQSQIRIGQRSITRKDQPEYFISRIVSNYFGWSFDSRLNREIRVKRGLTYGAWGGYIAHNMAGEFTVSTFTKTESTAEAVKALLTEIENLTATPPTGKELEDSKNYITGSFVRNRETPQQVARDLWLIESQRLDKDYLEKLLGQVTETTRQECVSLVEETIDPSRLTIVVMGDAEKLVDKLKPIAPVTVVSPETAVACLSE